MVNSTEQLCPQSGGDQGQAKQFSTLSVSDGSDIREADKARARNRCRLADRKRWRRRLGLVITPPAIEDLSEDDRKQWAIRLWRTKQWSDEDLSRNFGVPLKSRQDPDSMLGGAK